MAKEGSTVSGLMDCFATMVVVALQYGVPLRDLVNKFAHVRFEPSGLHRQQEIPIAKSIVDYIFRWLGSRFLGRRQGRPRVSSTAVPSRVPRWVWPSAPSAPVRPVFPPPAPDEAAPVVAPTAGPTAAFGGGQSGDEPKTGLAVVTDVAREGRVGRDWRIFGRCPRPLFEQTANASVAAAGSVSSGTSSPARDELAVEATIGHAAPAKAGSNGNGSGTVTLSLGIDDVAFKIQEDAPSCAECGSIMVRNGSCSSA